MWIVCQGWGEGEEQPKGSRREWVKWEGYLWYVKVFALDSNGSLGTTEEAFLEHWGHSGQWKDKIKSRVNALSSPSKKILD